MARSDGASQLSRWRDQRLIRKLVSGDRGAANTLVPRLLPVIRGRASRRLYRAGLNPNDTLDDVVQEIWLVLVQGKSGLLGWAPQRGLSLENYVGMIAEREVGNFLDRLRTKKRGGHLARVDVGALDRLSTADSPIKALQGKRLAEALSAHLVQALSARDHLVFQSIHRDGLSATEIAEAYGIPAQTVYNVQHRIRTVVRRFMASRG